jgi:hypothetical protein
MKPYIYIPLVLFFTATASWAEIPNTFYILKVESVVGRASLCTKVESVRAEAACSLAPIGVRRKDKPKETAWAGYQWGEQKLEGDNVLAQEVRIYRVETFQVDFDEFLKDNGYEIIPEKEE